MAAAPQIETEMVLEAIRESASGRFTLSLKRDAGVREVSASHVVLAIPLTTLRNWEQGVCEPDRAAKVLLATIATDPELVARAARHAQDPEYLAAGPARAA